MNKMRYLRIAVAAAVLAAVFACTFLHVPVGTLCALCPVSFAEVAVAGGSVPWALLPGVLVVLAVVFLLGRVFCSWVCPTSLLRNIFGGRRPRGLTGRTGECPGCGDAAGGCDGVAEVAEVAGAAGPACAICAAVGENSASAAHGGRAGGGSPCAAVDGDAIAVAVSGLPAEGEPQGADRGAVADPNRFRLRNSLAAQGIVLAALLVISLIVHFPVFCLFCPIGLVFGTMFAVSRLLFTWQPGWELIVFPVMLALELFVLRRWCSAICPLGFFFGLMAKARERLGLLPRVRVDKGTCIHGEGCEVCATTCPEDICAPTADGRDLQDCTLCLDCREHCPTRSISIGPKQRG